MKTKEDHIFWGIGGAIVGLAVAFVILSIDPPEDYGLIRVTARSTSVEYFEKPLSDLPTTPTVNGGLWLNGDKLMGKLEW